MIKKKIFQNKKWFSLKALCCFLLVGFCLNTIPHSSKAEGNYILTTASTGGTYYPVGVAISTLIKVKLQNKSKIGMSAIPSAGSKANVNLLRKKEAHFGILQALYGYYAREGVGPFESIGAQDEIYSVSMLWPNVEHFTINKKYAKSGTVADMANVKGMNVALGKQNSGTLGSNTVILKSLGLDVNQDFELFHAGYGPSMTALTDGKVVAAGTPAGPPVGAVTSAFASKGDKLQLLSFTQEQLNKANKGYGVWGFFTIPANTYPGLSKPIKTIAQPNFLAVRKDVPKEDIFKILDAIYSNLAFLKNIHQATGNMSLEKNESGVSTALAGLPLKLHPGAVEYYETKGIKVPANLK